MGVISRTYDNIFFFLLLFKLKERLNAADIKNDFFLVVLLPICSLQAIFCMFVSVRVSGVCVKDRWRELLQVTQPHTDDHVTLFNDFHFLMVSLGAKESGTSRRLLEGLQELTKQVPHNFFSSLHTSTLRQPYIRATQALCKTETETRLSVGWRDRERMQPEREFRAAVHLGERDPPSVADVPAAAASVEFCGRNVFWHPDHGQPVLSILSSTTHRKAAI